MSSTLEVEQGQQAADPTKRMEKIEGVQKKLAWYGGLAGFILVFSTGYNMMRIPGIIDEKTPQVVEGEIRQKVPGLIKDRVKEIVPEAAEAEVTNRLPKAVRSELAKQITPEVLDAINASAASAEKSAEEARKHEENARKEFAEIVKLKEAVLQDPLLKLQKEVGLLKGVLPFNFAVFQGGGGNPLAGNEAMKLDYPSQADKDNAHGRVTFAKPFSSTEYLALVTYTDEKGVKRSADIRLKEKSYMMLGQIPASGTVTVLVYEGVTVEKK